VAISFTRLLTRKEKGMTIYSVYKEDHPVIPKEVVTVVDLGYLGIEKDFPEQLSALPCKKKINQSLSGEEKEYNKSHSKERIVIEHTIICRLKKYRILADVFRNKLKKYNKVSDIVAGLVNYRIMKQNH
jgi:DDE superfamily endonuclease